MRLRRVIPAAAAATAFLAVWALLASGQDALYGGLLRVWGAYPSLFPFVDTHSVLAAIACHRSGVDVFVEDPCDVFRYRFDYSPLWLAASVAPVTVDMTPAVGLTCAALFFAALIWLPPGRRGGDVAVITCASLSGTVAFAVERANADLLMFCFAVLTVRLALLHRSLRFLGFAAASFAGMLKFYPAVLLILAVRERLAVCVAIGAASMLAGIGFVMVYASDLGRALAAAQSWPYTAPAIFGARDLPYGLTAYAHLPPVVAPILMTVLCAALALSAFVLSGRGDLPARIARLRAEEAAFLLAGSAVMLGCFLTAQNNAYRGIHLLLALPGLLALIRPEGMPRDRVIAAGCGVILLLMWWDLVRRVASRVLTALAGPDAAHHTLWLAHELAWWLGALVLAVPFIALLRNARTIRGLMACMRPRTGR